MSDHITSAVFAALKDLRVATSSSVKTDDKSQQRLDELQRSSHQKPLESQALGHGNYYSNDGPPTVFNKEKMPRDASRGRSRSQNPRNNVQKGVRGPHYNEDKRQGSERRDQGHQAYEFRNHDEQKKVPRHEHRRHDGQRDDRRHQENRNSGNNTKRDFQKPGKNIYKNHPPHHRQSSQAAFSPQRDNFPKVNLGVQTSRDALSSGFSKNIRSDRNADFPNRKQRNQPEFDENEKNNQNNDFSFNGKRRHEPKSRFGYKRLEEMASDDAHKIAIELGNTYNGFQYLLEQDNFLKEKPDWIVLITKLLAKVCGCEFRENKIKVLLWVCESNFTDLAIGYLLSVSSETKSHKNIKNLNSFLGDLLTLIETLVNLFENIAKERFHEPVRKMFGYIACIETLAEIKVDESLKSDLTALANRLKNMGSVADNVRKNQHLDEGQPPEDFRSIALYPAPEELLQDAKVFLRRSIVDRGYENVEHYLDIQFRLLRQDLIEPLRTGFKELLASLTIEDRRKPRINNLRLFKKCVFEKIVTIQDKMSYKLCFDVDRKLNHINWEYNRWFMFGSLVFFSFDNFTTFFMGTVFEKNNKTIAADRSICVELIGDIQLEVEDFGKPVKMAESTIFFQPYYHVMKAMKQFEEKNFPMERYIIHVNPVMKPPAYLLNNSYLQVQNLPEFDVLNEFAWPSPDTLGLDKFQFEAYKGALTREFVIMQGPPGTGKTYLGLKIVETLLKNDSIMEYSGAPILLVCYTNHALDQFLEGILKYTTSIVRVGSQTKSELIKPFELKERRKHFMYDKGIQGAYITMRDEMRDLMINVKTLEKILEDTDTIGILKPESLTPIMSKSHQNQLKSSNDLVQWLLVKDYVDSSQEICIDEDQVSEDENAEIHNQQGNASNESEEDDDDDDGDEARNQLRYDESLVADLVIDETKMNLHILTIQSLNKQLEQINFKIEVIEQQHHLHPPSEYAKMRNDVEVKWKQLNEAINMLDFQFKRLKKSFKVRDCTNLNTDLMKMNMNERWNIYWNWVTNFKAELMTSIKNTEAQHRVVSEQFSEAKQLQDMHVLLSHKILGTTTTAAAKYHLMLSALKPKIVVVEEAAEVLEAHIVTALTSHCEHLILIGDHQQLRPNPTVYKLAKQYNLEISLFERMIKNKLTFSTLGVQHRMRPEICDLITPVIYPNLENHPSVFGYDKVKGVSKNMFFVTHEVPEEFDDIGQSYKNSHEGDFLLKLARYLLFQGYSPDQITILTTYSGQLIYLKMQKKKMPEIREVRISTVDNYQGEECRIILLSLVRSNMDRKIGFLSTPNRVCVALSRAKHGFYLIGNMSCLEESSEIWPEIKKQLAMHQAVGPELQLECDVHQNITSVSNKVDFQNVTEGGCSEMCDAPLNCGHSCKRLCHPTDRTHEFYKCPEKCNKNCPAGHPCKNRCYEECSVCRVLVTRHLVCGHKINLHCYIDASSYPCKESVELMIELCGHKARVPCHIARSNENIRCTKPCESRLKCGHACTRACHVDEDPDHLDFQCMKPCERKNANCSAEHYCKKLCHEKCSVCNERVLKVLPCSHETNVLCHLDPDYVQCDRPCTNILDCNHKCRKRCIDMCGECTEMVDKVIPECLHTVSMKCMTPPQRKHCKNSCEKLLMCGHRCAKKCCDDCNPSDCEVLVNCTSVQSLCGHPTMIPCKDKHKNSADLIKLALDHCPEPCRDKLLCEHLCQGTCSGCKQGRLHEMCKEKCGRVKICGHSCNVDCSALCPPCKLPCMTKCHHSKCPSPCGEKCPDCMEWCPWQCEHKRCKRKCSQMCKRTRCYKYCKTKLQCGHRCIGFCGEPCPPKCRICDKDEVTSIFFGTEDEEDARFVVLEDCGHFFESSGLETYLGLSAQVTDQDKEILMPTCPQCKTPIVSTLRFMNQTRKVLKDIAEVKKKQNGMKRTIMQMKMDVIRRLRDLDKYLPKQDEKKKFLNSSKYFSVILRNIGLQVEDTRLVNNKGKTVTVVNRVTHSQMVLFVFIVEFMETVKNRVLEIKTLGAAMSCQLLRLLDEILVYVIHIPNDKLSPQQALDLNYEMARFSALVNLLELKTAFHEFVNYTNERILIQLYDQCMGEILCLDRFDQARRDLVDGLLNGLDERAKEGVPRGLTPEERRMIHAAMVKSFYPGNEQGHWFKCGSCPEIYCITECGGAMQMAKCPTCKATIGGEQHRYVAGTRLASEMDGASRPAWPVTLH